MQQGSAFSRRTFLTGAAALGALTLAACATPAAPGGGGSTGNATKVDTVNLYNNTLGEDAQKQAWQTMISNYQASSPGTTVKPVIYPYDQAATQLALMAKSGNLMGVGQAGPWQVLTPFGILADLTDLAAGLDIPQGILDAYTLNGQLLVLPQNAGGIGQVVNGQVASSVGLTSGLTTDAFATVLEKIKSQDSTLIPYAAVTKNPDLKDIVPWMWGFGSDVVTDDLKCTIGDAQSVAAVTWYKSLQDQGLIAKNVARSDARILFARGQAIMYDDAPLASSFVKTNGAAQGIIDNITAISRPTYQGKPSYNRAWGGGLFATAGVGELTSRDFITSMVTNLDSATALFTQSSLVPASKKISDQIPAITKDAFQTQFRTAVTESARATAYDKIAVTAQIDTTIGAGVANILAGQVGVQSGLNDLKSQVQSLLDDNK
jgi:multiple sugar transport system substrate-binding protein